MRVELEIKDSKAEFVMNVLSQYSFVKVKELEPVRSKNDEHLNGKKGAKKLPHNTYRKIANAVLTGKLPEEFSPENVCNVCDINANTPGTFLHKHRKGNPDKNTILFEQTSKGRYKLIYPLKYGLQVLADLREAVDEMKLVSQGKLKARPAEELYNEL